MKSAAQKKQSGFTIIELLLALSILTSISVFAITMISNQIETRNRLSRVNDTHHALDVAMQKVFDDFRHVYIVRKEDAGSANLEGRPVKPAFVWRPVGDEGAFYFSTQNYHSVLSNTPQSNLAMVAYFKKKEKDGQRLQLIRRVDLDFKEGVERPGVGKDDVLVTDLKDFKVIFWDGADFGREDWDTTNGDTTNKLPKMAKISISIYMPPTEEDKLKPDYYSNRDRPFLALETIVYLMNSAGQPDLKDPAKEYKWR